MRRNKTEKRTDSTSTQARKHESRGDTEEGTARTEKGAKQNVCKRRAVFLS